MPSGPWGKYQSHQRHHGRENWDPEANADKITLADFTFQSEVHSSRELKELYERNPGTAPWYKETFSFWTRYNEVVIGKRPWYAFDPRNIPANVGTYRNITAADDFDRKHKYFLEQNRSLVDGFVFRSVIKDSSGIYRRNFDIEFRIKADDETEADIAEVTIFNVDPSMQQFFEKAPIVIRSGYVESYDVIFAGRIDTIEPVIEDSGTAIKIRAVSDYIAFMGLLPEPASYPIGTKYLTIINDLVAKMPVPVGYIYPLDKLIEQPFSWQAFETIKMQFDKLTDELHFNFNIQSGRIYFVPIDIDVWLGGTPFPVFNLDAARGLIKVDKDTDEDVIKWKITAFLVPFYAINSVLIVNSKRMGWLELKITEIEWRSTDISHYAIMKCDTLNIKGPTPDVTELGDTGLEVW